MNAVDYARRQPGVSVVSMSWGGGEFYGEWYYDSFFTTPAGHIGGSGRPGGVTFVAAAGDSPGVSYPAASPNVLAIGGTSLTLNSNNTYGGETPWSSSGGGISAYESKPGYQLYVNASMRAVPDIGYDAARNSGFYVYNTVGGGGWYTSEGTSAGAPQWAALLAIADEGRALNGLGSLSSTQTLVAINETLPRSDFHVINGYYNTQTGWGTPYANKVISHLAGGTITIPG